MKSSWRCKDPALCLSRPLPALAEAARLSESLGAGSNVQGSGQEVFSPEAPFTSRVGAGQECCENNLSGAVWRLVLPAGGESVGSAEGEVEELLAGRSEHCSLPSARGPAPPCPPGAESCSGCHRAVFPWMCPGPWKSAVPDVLGAHGQQGAWAACPRAGAGQGGSAPSTHPRGCRRSDAMHRHGGFLTPTTPSSEPHGDHLWDLTPSSPHPKGCYFIPITITWPLKVCCFVRGINASDLNLTRPTGTQRLLSCFTLLEFSFIFELGHWCCMEGCALELAGAPAVLGMPCCLQLCQNRW